MVSHSKLPIGPPSADVPGALSDLLETLAILWPGADIQVVSEGSPQGATRFVALPSDTHPRMLVPDSRRASSSALMRFSSALGPGQVAARCWGAAACRTLGPARVGGSTIAVTGGTDTLLDHLGGILDAELSASLTIGEARVNRKPVLQLFDAAGRSVGFAKVGINDDTAGAIGHEAAALRLFDGSAAGIDLPRLIDLGSWRGHPVLLMTALLTGPPLPGDDRAPLDAMAAFSLALGHEVAPLTAVPQWQRIRTATANERRLGLEELTARIETLAATLPDPVVGCWHGDWTPWNMCRARNGRLRLWDLERFERGAVHGIDAFHFCVNDSTRARGEQPEAIIEGMRAAWQAVGGGHMQRLVGAVYLAVISERYLASVSSSPIGHLIDARLRACVEALRVWLDEAQSGRS